MAVRLDTIHLLINHSEQTTGQVDSADMTADGDIVVAFKSRSAAEQVRCVLAPQSTVFTLFSGSCERLEHSPDRACDDQLVYWPATARHLDNERARSSTYCASRRGHDCAHSGGERPRCE